MTEDGVAPSGSSLRSTVRIPHWFQGPTGSGQGGWTAARLVDIVGQPVTMSIKAPIPLDVDLSVVEFEGGWQLSDPSSNPPTPIMQARRWNPDFSSTAPVSANEALAAKALFPFSDADHPAPDCFSCGIQHDSMRVHAGPLGDGRFASDWKAPAWSVGADRSVDGAVLWAALDCVAAWQVICDGATRIAATVQYAAEVAGPVEPDETYALVAWDPTGHGWDGRKRSGSSAAFASDGTCIAQSRSFWVALD